MASWEEAQPGQMIQTDQRAIPYVTIKYNVLYVKWVGGERGDVWSDGICHPESPLGVMGLCSPGDGATPACP